MRTTIKSVMSAAGCAALAVALTACPSPKQEAPEYELPEINDIVMYQVNPRVFAAQNSLRAVAERVDSIADMGVNVVWVMPIYPIGEEKTKNSPYSIRDYKAIAPEFGTIDDFKALVDSCHAHGMSIILDWVANHTAWDSKWLKDEGHTDWYTHNDKGEIVAPIDDWSDVADLNYDNNDMRAAMREAMLYWVRDIGIDGFRCDVADMVPLDFWKGAIDSLRAAAAPRKIVMLAEGNHVENLTVAGFDMNYAWDFMHDLRKVWKGEPASLALKSDSAEYAPLPAGKVKMRFTTNHDESTHGTPYIMFGGDRGAMAAYVATVYLHGGPLIYGSQEVGYQDSINFFHYVPVNWMAKPEIRNEYKKLIALLKDNDALMHGAPAGIPDDNVLAFTKGNGEFLVLVNVRDKENTLALPEEWAGKSVTDLMTDAKRDLLNAVTLQPYEYLILKK